MNVPDNLRYTASHEWVRLEGDEAVVGITDHAQAELTDIVYVELPAVGTDIESGAAVAVVESVKAASDIYAPVSGIICEVNDALTSDPSLVNTDPYDKGWLYKLEVRGAEEIEALKNAAAYREQISQ